MTDLEDLKEEVLGELNTSAMSLGVNELSGNLGLDAANIMPALASLKKDGLVDREAGKWVILDTCCTKTEVKVETIITKAAPANLEQAATAVIEDNAKAVTDNGFRMEVVDITPDLAVELLKSNTINRALRPSVIENYSILMRDGKWMLNGEGISIATGGTLLNGQHRLRAIIRANVTVRLPVFYNVDKEAFTTYDQGSVRTGKDILTTQGIHPRKAMMLSAGIRLNILFTNTGKLGSHYHIKNKLTNDEVLKEYNRTDWYDKCAQYIIDNYPRQNLPTSSGHLTFLLYRFFSIDSDFTGDWLDGMISGTGLQKDDFRLWVRDYLWRDVNSLRKTPTKEKTKLIAKAWHYARTNREVVHSQNFLRVDENSLAGLKLPSDSF